MTRLVANGTNRTTSDVRSSVATGGKPDMAGQPNSVEIDPKRLVLAGSSDVRFLIIADRIERSIYGTDEACLLIIHVNLSTKLSSE